MDKKQIEKLIKYALSLGVDFVELYFEETKLFYSQLSKDIVEDCNIKKTNGLGIRLSKNGVTCYSHTANYDYDNIIKIIDNLSSIYELEKKKVKFKLNRLKKAPKNKRAIHIEDYSVDKLKTLLKDGNLYAKGLDKDIKNVELGVKNTHKNITIANSIGTFTNEERFETRFVPVIYLEKNGKNVDGFESTYKVGGLEFFDKLNYKKAIKNSYVDAKRKMKSINIEGGLMPIILDGGRGGTLFHEAVGHSLEADAIARGQSTFCDMIGKKIASEVVTLIDDGTIKGLFGTTYFDDEGEKTRRNILIENGILKSYLVDRLNGEKLNMPSTGSSRRESYKFAPTSRMNNTYLDKGKDRVKDMIESIDYGVFVYTLAGGQVDPETGDFTFGVGTARLIEKGKLTKYISNITLIGKCNDVLHKVTMVSDDVGFRNGTCGASSGYASVTDGNPTVKISEILVGGKSDE